MFHAVGEFLVAMLSIRLAASADIAYVMQIAASTIYPLRTRGTSIRFNIYWRAAIIRTKGANPGPGRRVVTTFSSTRRRPRERPLWPQPAPTDIFVFRTFRHHPASSVAAEYQQCTPTRSARPATLPHGPDFPILEIVHDPSVRTDAPTSTLWRAVAAALSTRRSTSPDGSEMTLSSLESRSSRARDSTFTRCARPARRSLSSTMSTPASPGDPRARHHRADDGGVRTASWRRPKRRDQPASSPRDGFMAGSHWDHKPRRFVRSEADG